MSAMMDPIRFQKDKMLCQLPQSLLRRRLLSAITTVNVFLMSMNGNMLLKEMMEEFGHGATKEKDLLTLPKFQNLAQEEMIAKVSIFSFQLKSVLAAHKVILHLA